MGCCDNPTRPEPAEPRSHKLHPGRYIVGTVAVSAWIMIAALHVPVEALLPDGLEILLYPSGRFFSPLTLLYISWLPLPDTPGTISHYLSIGNLVAMCVMDLVIGAILCLPLLFSRGRKQDMTAGIALVLVAGYAAWAAFHYFTH